MQQLGSLDLNKKFKFKVKCNSWLLEADLTVLFVMAFYLYQLLW
jgi:hypothetical protein